MSINNINNFNNKPNLQNNEYLFNLINNNLDKIEKRTKNISIKDLEIKENIYSIRLKEKKIEKINQTILNQKEELKLLKELLILKEEKNMNIKDIMDSYIDFLISSNDMIDDKLNSLFQKEVNINSKQKHINKLLGEDNNDNDYDYIYENINKPIDISKFLIKPKIEKSKNYNITENGGEKYGRYINNKINNQKNNINNNINKTNKNENINNNYIEYNYKNLYQSKKNKISSSSSYEKLSNGIKLEEIPCYNNSKNRNSNKKNNEKKNNMNKLNQIDENIIFSISDSSKKYEKFISPKSVKNNNYKKKQNHKINNDYSSPLNNEYGKFINDENEIKNDNDYKIDDININDRNNNKKIKDFEKTDVNDYNKYYNLEPNNNLKRAREIFKRLLNKLKMSNELFFTNNNSNKSLANFIINVLKTKYFLRKILSIIFECADIYNPNSKRTITETIHDSEFLTKLNYNYDDSDEEKEKDNLNNIKMFEKGLEEIKKITKETKQLQDRISQFAYKINVTG